VISARLDLLMRMSPQPFRSDDTSASERERPVLEQDASLVGFEARVEARRQDVAFQERVRTIIEENREALDRLAET
jgi:hypothetical protein